MSSRYSSVPQGAQDATQRAKVALVSAFESLFARRPRVSGADMRPQDFDHYTEPIARIPADALRLADMFDGVARIDASGSFVKQRESDSFRVSIEARRLRERPHFDFSFTSDVLEPKSEIVAFERISYSSSHMPNELSSVRAAYSYAARFAPIFHAVERRYMLPKGMLTALCMVTSHGIEPASIRALEGRFGVIALDDDLAHEYGLALNPRAHVSSATSIRERNLELAYLAQRLGATGDGRATLIEQDERWNVLACADAVGRMVASFNTEPEAERAPAPYWHALACLAGSVDREEFVEQVLASVGLVNDLEFIAATERSFTEANFARRMRDGSLVTLGRWCAEYGEYLHRAYPITAYRALPLAATKVATRSARVFQTSVLAFLQQRKRTKDRRV